MPSAVHVCPVCGCVPETDPPGRHSLACPYHPGVIDDPEAYGMDHEPGPPEDHGDPNAYTGDLDYDLDRYADEYEARLERRGGPKW